MDPAKEEEILWAALEVVFEGDLTRRRGKQG